MSAASEEEEAGAPRTATPPGGPALPPTLRPLRPEVSILLLQVEDNLAQVPLGNQNMALSTPTADAWGGGPPPGS